jgi:ribonuclease T2
MKKLFTILALIALTAGSIGLSSARQSNASKVQTESVAGVFDYYLLTLSWSPTFCLTHKDDVQCSGKGYGFVLHGLWPQYAKGGWPESCPPLTTLSAAETSKGLTLFPTKNCSITNGPSTALAAVWARWAIWMRRTKRWAR